MVQILLGPLMNPRVWNIHSDVVMQGIFCKKKTRERLRAAGSFQVIALDARNSNRRPYSKMLLLVVPRFVEVFFFLLTLYISSVYLLPFYCFFFIINFLSASVDHPRI